MNNYISKLFKHTLKYNINKSSRRISKNVFYQTVFSESFITNN